ncbi:hypothetical protein GCM10025783_04380 [Amnibacterium soli]|uniref:TadE family protein n=1 Tax=Amnibacterium soli TaxID=1282736 RepID=A0ABP8YS06_9MICO
MPRSNPSPDAERGSAAVEVLVLGVLLLVPLVYLVLTVAALQGAAFAAEGAARQAARSIAIAATDGEGRRAADAAAEVALADWHVAPGATRSEVRCAPDPGDCETPRGSVDVRVRVATALPLLPPALDVDAPAAVPIEAHAVQRVSMFAAVR